VSQARITVGIRDVEIARVMKEVRKRVGKANVAVGRVIAKYGRIIERRIKELMQQTPRTGRKYSRGHIASSPGQAPAIDLSGLWDSIHAELTRLSAIVWTDQEYAPHLEYGTLNMAARPSFRVAFEEYREEILREIKKALKESLE